MAQAEGADKAEQGVGVEAEGVGGDLVVATGVAPGLADGVAFGVGNGGGESGAFGSGRGFGEGIGEVFGKNEVRVAEDDGAFEEISGEEADVEGKGGGAADAFKDTLLEDAEEFGLEGQGKFADFVEEDGAAFGQFELAFLLSHRAGESALLVAEEFTFEQGVGEGGERNGDGVDYEGPVRVPGAEREDAGGRLRDDPEADAEHHEGVCGAEQADATDGADVGGSGTRKGERAAVSEVRVRAWRSGGLCAERSLDGRRLELSLRGTEAEERSETGGAGLGIGEMRSSHLADFAIGYAVVVAYLGGHYRRHFFVWWE